MVEWVSRLLEYAEKNNIKTVATTVEAEEPWLGTIQAIATQLVAVQSIHPGEEVTIDYGCTLWFDASE